MKYILKLTLGLLMGTGFFAACSDDSDEKTVAFSLDKEEISIGNNGGADQLAISTDGKWFASTDKSWIKITPANGVGTGQCTVSIDSTVVSVNREGIIRIVTDRGEQKKVSIYQLGYEKGIFLHQADTIIESSGKLEERFLKVKLTTNLKFNVAVQDPGNKDKRVSWLEYNDKDFDLDYGDRPRTIQISFKWENNPKEEGRLANVLFTPKGESNPAATLVIHQKSAPEITDDRAGDSLAILSIAQMANFIFETWDASENMQYWSGVSLWEKTDKEVKENPDMLGRVRSANFFYVNTNENIPYQVAKLKYAETLNFFSNTNKSLRNIDLDPSPLLGLKYLKNLEISSYGIKSIDDSFKQLGDRLVSLDLGGNNLTEIPWWLNSANFPHLKALKLSSMRRWETVRNLHTPEKEDFGLHLKTDHYTFVELLKWSQLDTLKLSYCFIEGELLEKMPGFETYDESEVRERNLPEILIGTPKVLPNTKIFSINLNFLSGKVPTWLLYHPYLSDWDPLVLVFNQEVGINSKEEKVGFTDAPASLDYYYKLYPDKKPNF